MREFGFRCFIVAIAIVVGETLCEEIAPEQRLSHYIATILNHYKQDDPIGAPIIPVPDPLDVPPLTNSVGLATMKCSNVSLYGLSKFRVDYVHVDLVEMQVKATIKIDTINITGDYVLQSWLSKSKGNFSVYLVNVTLEATSGLQVEEDDQLAAQEIYTDFFNENITMEFNGLNSFEKSMISTSGAFIFESSKPYMMREMNSKLREDINAQVKQIPQKFPKPVAPIDQLIAKTREYARINYEPLKLDDYQYSTTISTTKLTHTWLYGVSNFYRVGEVTLEIRNKTIVFKVDLGAEHINGSTHWEFTLMKGKRAGTAAFSVNDFGVEIVVSQPMDTRKPPHLENIHLTVGEIRIGFNGAGIVDIPVMVVGNILPKMLNQQIVGCLELMLKIRLRQIFSEVRMDEVVLGNLNSLDKLQESGQLTKFLIK